VAGPKEERRDDKTREPAPRDRLLDSKPPGTQRTDSSRVPKSPEAKTRDEDDAPKLPALPSPSLPKGGGAVRGLGETFQVNAANGTFTASIPLPTAEARGFSPSLSLRYDSGAGNSPFGEGWSVAVPSVSRKTDKVLPRYQDADVFVADGEDLVPAQAPDGGPWIQGHRDAGTHDVQCFSPRVESGYDRCERWTRKSDGDVHWRTRTKDGRTNVFGESPTARVADPADPTQRIFRWLLERSFDDRGNLTRYLYRAEDRVNVAADIWEQQRAPVYLHLDRVLWGLRAPWDSSLPAPSDPSAYLFELVFDYGERDGIVAGSEPPYAPPATWTVRADSYSFFKPGFEVRCYRLCKRVLLFHRVDETGTTPSLVREIALRHDEDPALAKLLGVTSVGWRAGVSATYPEATFSYAVAQVDPTVRQIDLGSAENLPPPVEGKRTTWIDLDGEGIPGALIEDRPGWYYKRNLGGGMLAPVEALPTRPSLERADGGRLVDLAGDGTKSLARFSGPAPGLFARTTDFDWNAFAAFDTIPKLDFDDPNLRFIDLDGDGRSDLLITEDDLLRWYPSLGYDGFGGPELVQKTHDEESGPALVFADAEQSIYLADMTGDGLTDLVRVRNGEVCYWPNLGYGRFGKKVTMGGAPRFAASFDFVRGSLRLADVDGTGTTDLLYCDGDQVRYWLNRAGNSFSDEQSVAGLPYDPTARIEAVDLLGNGTSCLVWSSPLPWHARQPLRFIELTGGIKPHLLRSLDNGLGRAIAVEYAASTSFYLADRAAGNPWITRVPFPVQVVKTITTFDQVGGSQLTADYSYHHGFYDGFEREFRGFGMVEQRDTQTLAALQSRGLFPPDVSLAPPVRTRTWFHTGAFLEGDSLMARYATEWFSEPDQARLDEGTLPAGLDPEEVREALRALRGKPLRVETYADDEPATPATAIPYRVVQTNYQVRAIQRRGSNLHGVFAADPLETLSYDYERDAGDPRVEHELVLSVGRYGGVEQSARVAYPRRGETEGTILGYGEHTLLARDDEAEIYRVNVAAETRLYQVTGLNPPSVSPFVMSRAALGAIPALAGTVNDLGFGDAVSPLVTQRRLLRRTQLSYYADDGVTPLAPGSFGAQALLHQSQRAMVPTAMVPSLLPPAVDAAMMGAAGYLSHDGHWWAPSNTVAYGAAAFFQPTRFTDPFGNSTRIDYDAFQLLPSTVTNPLLQTIVVGYDYLALQPSSITDANGNASLAAYDALGRLSDVAETGKLGEGDSLPAPTVHYAYSITDWKTLGRPNWGYTRQRLVYATDGFAEIYRYSDGFDRELQTKVKASDGPALQVAGGVLSTVNSADRWVASGRTVYDNKGNAVRKYEPWYAVGSAYEADPLLAFFGVSTVLRYDPLGRLVRADAPDGTFSTVALGAWERVERDGADNAAEEAQLWINRPGQSAADQRATAATLLHRRTPRTVTVDALGREVAADDDNTIQGAVSDVPPGSHVLYRSARRLDLEGRLLAVFDDRGLNAIPSYATVAHDYDMIGQALRTVGAETGTACALPDCLGQPFYARDARGFELRYTRDVLRREIRVDAADTAHAVSYVAERTVWGDDPAAPVDASANRLGRIYQRFDQAGIATRARYDFKGNLVAASRQLISTRSGAPDWTATWLTPFSTTMEYDAVSRVTRATLPRRDATKGVDNVVARDYQLHGPLARLSVQTQYGAGAVDVLSQIDYDAQGRRLSARYGNGVVRTYTYDPLTFRLSTMSATRGGGESLQSIVYTWDATGNLTEVNDTAQPVVFKNNARIEPRLAYTYDSIYRLTDATGRELHDPTQPTDADAAFGVWSPDGNDLVNYLEHYDYDSVGNITKMVHRANNNTQSWTRGYGYATRSNLLAGTSLPGAPDPAVLGASYGYDAAGNTTSMPHLSTIEWDERGRLASADQNGGGILYHRYDCDGMRVRKAQTTSAGGGERVVYERIYLGEYELYRALDAGGNATVEIESVHGLDGAARVLLADTQTSDATPSPVQRYQLDNHLGSAVLELDGGAALLSYEELHPFGSTAYHARDTVAEVSLRRYRFLGKERDDETGFTYCNARHYCGWLGRWINADPKGVEGGMNLYAYSHNRPIVASDPGGLDDDDTPAPRPAAPIYNQGLSQPGPLPPYASHLHIVTELNLSGGASTTSDPAVGATGTGFFQGNVRVRTSEHVEQGPIFSIGGVAPFAGRTVALANPGSSFEAGSLLYGVHAGQLAPPEDAEGTQVRVGNWTTAGLVFGNYGRLSTNPTLSNVFALSISRDWFGLDLNAGASIAAAGSVNNRNVFAPVNVWGVANFSVSPDSWRKGTSINLEGMIGGNFGVGGLQNRFDPSVPGAAPTPGVPGSGDPSIPGSLRWGVGLGFVRPIFRGDYTIGAEVTVTGEAAPNVVGPGTVSATGAISRVPLPLTVGVLATLAAF
jgi:RHS repeat-associated protein